ncbi:hypothetical protein GCM10022234_29830 [Aeromicrobium panaciterrae]
MAVHLTGTAVRRSGAANWATFDVVTETPPVAAWAAGDATRRPPASAVMHASTDRREKREVMKEFPESVGRKGSGTGYQSQRAWAASAAASRRRSAASATSRSVVRHMSGRDAARNDP